ncbi:MAG: SDR family oxidoreductase [Nitratireductor sp.]|nr:SDR family oxidoreductase [Nitratireductor sp.]
MTRYDFSGRTVLISGAGGGLGRNAALRFAESGADLVLTDRSEAALDPVREALGPAGNALFITGDVANPDFHNTLASAAVERFGSLDIALNNAGIGHRPGRIEKIDRDEAQRVIEVDLLAVLYAMQAQIPIMRQQFERTGEGGVILNTASVAGVVGSPTLSVYAAAKHGVIGLTRTAAIETARSGIRINALCPAFTRTAMVDELVSTSPHGAEAAEQKLTGGIPIGRIAKVDEIVQAMLWACAPENAFYTGQALVLDGGLSAG